jgi:lysophospholipase L1-like esterase
MVSIIRSARVLLALLCIQPAIALLPLNALHGADPGPSPAVHQYTGEVAKFAAAPAPAPGGVLMVGSSIFRKWLTCAHDLAPLPVINRAFGGSVTSDQLFFFDQIVPSSRAALVVWYCGSNDLKARGTPDSILKNTKEWIGRTHAALPRARIVLVSVIRAPQKREAGLLPQVDAVNRGYFEIAGSDPAVVYVDVNPALETPAGAAVAECYVQDKLHLTPEGYTRMTSALLPVIEKEWKATAALHPSP